MSTIACLLCGNPILAPLSGVAPGGEHKRRMHYVCLYSTYTKLTEEHSNVQANLGHMTSLKSIEAREKNRALLDVKVLADQVLEMQKIIQRLQAQVQAEADRRSLPGIVPPRATPPAAPKEPEKKVDRFALIEIE